MKKIIKVLSISILSSLLFLNSCGKEKNYSSIKDSNEVSSTKHDEIDFVRLLAPTNISFDVETRTLSWQSVDGAISYDINVNGKLIRQNLNTNKTTIAERYIDISSTTEKYLISVRAKNESYRSNFSSILFDPQANNIKSAFSYNLNDDGLTLTISSLNNNVTLDYDNLVIPDSFNNLVINTIGKNLFAKNKRISKITLSDNIEIIEENAFDSSYVSEIILSNNLKTIKKNAFANTNRLKSLTIPASLITIEDDAFNSSAIATLVFDDNSNLTTIGNNAFSSCKIKELNLIKSIKDVGENVFSGCSLTSINFENGILLDYLSDGMFKDNKSLKEIVLPTNITKIGNNCFSNCTNLNIVNYQENNLTLIGDSAFSGCNNLKYFGNNLDFVVDKNVKTCDVVIPNNVISIGDSAFNKIPILNLTFAENSKIETINTNAFANNTNITTLSLPKSIINIKDNAFANCSNLENISFDDGANPIFIDSTAFNKTKYISNLADQKIQFCNVLYKASKEELNQEIYNLDENIISISNNAFANSSIKILNLTGNVKYIGVSAFERSTKLTSLNISNNVEIIDDKAFSGCSKLENIEFNNNNVLKTIGNGTFKNCYSITNFVLPDSVVSLGDEAFANSSRVENNQVFGNSKLESFVISNDSHLESIGVSCFEGNYNLTDINLPDSLIEIKDGAFKNTLGLLDVHLSNNSNLKTIGNKSFNYCGINHIVLGNNLEYIANEAFLNAINLENVTFLDNSFANSIDKTIYSNTFENCIKLTQITLSDNIEVIQDNAFLNCVLLENIQTDAHNIGKDAFKNTYFENNATDGLIYLNNVLIKYVGNDLDLVINQDIEHISYNAFLNSNIRSITLPDSLISIHDNAFENCQNLLRVSFNNNHNLLTIGENAFNNNSKLEFIDIPDSLTSIGKKAFYGCINLNNVDFSNTNLIEIPEQCFYGANSLKEIKLNDSLKTISKYAFYKTSLEKIIIPSSLEIIGDYSFANIGRADNKYLAIENWNITNTLKIIDLSNANSLNHIGKYAFYNNIVENIVFLDHPLTLDEYAFANSIKLEKIELNDNVLPNKGIIQGCNNLSEITLSTNYPFLALFGGYVSFVPTKLETINVIDGTNIIPDNYFNGLGMVKNINLPDSIITIEDNAFYGCREISSINLTNVESIGNNAFNGCNNLIDITTSNNLNYIGNRAFYATKYLNSLNNQDFVSINGILIKYNGLDKNVVLDENIKEVSGGAFSGNLNVENIVMSSNVTTLFNGAFDSCYNLKSITLNSPEVVNIDISIFDTLNSDFKVYVDKGLVNQYKENIYWSLYADNLNGK